MSVCIAKLQEAVSNLLTSEASHSPILGGGRLTISIQCSGLARPGVPVQCGAVLPETHAELCQPRHDHSEGWLTTTHRFSGFDRRGHAKASGGCLGELATNRDHKVTFAEEGGLRCMIAVARERDLQLRVLGVSALRHLSPYLLA